MLTFLAVPVVKLHKIPLIIVALIGAGMAILNPSMGCTARTTKDDAEFMPG